MPRAINRGLAAVLDPERVDPRKLAKAITVVRCGQFLTYAVRVELVHHRLGEHAVECAPRMGMSEVKPQKRRKLPLYRRPMMARTEEI